MTELIPFRSDDGGGQLECGLTKQEAISHAARLDQPASEPLSSMGRAALEIAAGRGWPVFPCDHRLDIPGDKRCKVPLIKNGFKNATTDPYQVETWWRRWPQALIGVPTGAVTGFWILDVDVDSAKGHDGPADLASLEAEHGTLPATAESRTPRGGRHKLFAWQEGVTNAQGQLPQSINVRGQGGYFIVPPSQREDGAAYAWENPLPLFQPVPAPEWLLELIRQKPAAARLSDTLRIASFNGRDRYAEAALRSECDAVAGQSEPGRNNRLNRAAFSLGQLVGGGLLDESTVTYSLLAAAGRCGVLADDGDRQTCATIASGLSDGMLEPRSVPDHKTAVEVDQSSDSRDQQQDASAAISADPFIWIDPASIPCRKFIYGRHYVRQFVSTTVAPGGVGKSSLGIAEALAIASGKPLLGVTPPERARTWLFNGEDPLEELQRRVMATALHYGLTREDFEGWLFLNSGRRTPIVVAEQARNGTQIMVPVVEAVSETIRANRIDVMCVDPFVSTHRVSENDNNAIERVAKTWAAIADETNAAIDLVHHSRKTGGADVTVEDARGASALLSAARSARVLNVMTEDECSRVGVENRRHYFRVDNGKSNLAPPVEKADWFKLISVDLGNGDPGDSVGVVTAYELPGLFDGVTVADLRKAQMVVAAGGPWRENSQAADWVGKPIATALQLDPDNKAHKRKIAGLLRVWIDSGMFVRVAGRDPKRREEKTFIEVGQWATD